MAEGRWPSAVVIHTAPLPKLLIQISPYDLIEAEQMSVQPQAASYDRIVHEANVDAEEIAEEVMAEQIARADRIGTGRSVSAVAQIAARRTRSAVMEGVSPARRDEAQKIAREEGRHAAEIVRREYDTRMLESQTSK